MSTFRNMGKQILVISSSPRKGGNSDLLCDQFLLGSSDAGHNSEKIFLKVIPGYFVP